MTVDKYISIIRILRYNEEKCDGWLKIKNYEIKIKYKNRQSYLILGSCFKTE